MCIISVDVLIKADQRCACVQARHNGFGITVRPGHMVASNGKALQQAISQVLQDTSFAVSLQQQCDYHLMVHNGHTAQFGTAERHYFKQRALFINA